MTQGSKMTLTLARVYNDDKDNLRHHMELVHLARHNPKILHCMAHIVLMYMMKEPVHKDMDLDIDRLVELQA